MSAEPHLQHAQRILDHLAGWGFPAEVQQRLGAFSVIWTTFETTLEGTLWTLRRETVRGEEPSTEAGGIGTWIKDLGTETWPDLSEEARALVSVGAAAAADLVAYRHALQHGWMIPSETMPTFVRNPSWNGEVRRRETGEAHVTKNLLDMAISSGWILCEFVAKLKLAARAPGLEEGLLALAPDLRKAASAANELRHLSALVDHDKY